MNAIFAELGKFLYSEGINRLEQLWIKCISLKGDNVRKLKASCPEKVGNFDFSHALFNLPSYIMVILQTFMQNETFWHNVEDIYNAT